MNIPEEQRKAARDDLVRAQSVMDRTWATIREMMPYFKRTMAKLEPYKDSGYGHLESIDIKCLRLALNVVSTEDEMKRLQRLLEDI